MSRVLCYIYEEPYLHIALYKKSGAHFIKEFIREFTSSNKKEAFSIIADIVRTHPESTSIVVASTVSPSQTIFLRACLQGISYPSLAKIIPLHFEEMLPFAYEKAAKIVRISREKKTTYVELEACNETLIQEEINAAKLDNLWLGSELELMKQLWEKESTTQVDALLVKGGADFTSFALYQDQKILEALSLENTADFQRVLTFFEKKGYTLPKHCFLLGQVPLAPFAGFTVIQSSVPPLDAIAELFYAQPSQALDFTAGFTLAPWRSKKRKKALMLLLSASCALVISTSLGAAWSNNSCQAKIRKELTQHLPLAKSLAPDEQKNLITSLIQKKKKFHTWQKKYHGLPMLLEQISSWIAQEDQVKLLALDFTASPKPILKVSLQAAPDAVWHAPYEPIIQKQEGKTVVLCYE